MTGSIKSAASHPGSLWITMLAAIGAALAGYTQNTEVVRSVDAFCHASENSSYQALVDLREKVDWIHSRVTANEEKLAFATSPPGGPAQPFPPDTTGSNESEPEPVDEKEVAPAEKEAAEEKVVPLKKNGAIDWAPIKRPN